MNRKNGDRLVVIVGGTTPPTGGVTVHVRRLGFLLSREGYEVQVFDVYGRKPFDEELPYKVHRGAKLSVLSKFLFTVLTRRPNIVHWHMASGLNLGPYLPVWRVLSAVTKLVITVHGGRFPERVGEAELAIRNRYAVAFSHASAVIGVSEKITKTLSEKLAVPPERIRMLPAYLPVSLEFGSENADVCEINEGVILATGFAHPTYNWEELIDALGELEYQRVDFVFYNTYIQPYFDEVLERLAESGLREVVVHRDISPRAFARMLEKAQIFVRPTLTDGDSVAVREALAIGTVVVASDSVERPDGCHVYSSGSSSDLNHLLQKALNGEITGSVETVDFGGGIAELYHQIVESELKGIMK